MSKVESENTASPESAQSPDASADTKWEEEASEVDPKYLEELYTAAMAEAKYDNADLCEAHTYSDKVQDSSLDPRCV